MIVFFNSNNIMTTTATECVLTMTTRIRPKCIHNNNSNCVVSTVSPLFAVGSGVVNVGPKTSEKEGGGGGARKRTGK